MDSKELLGYASYDKPWLKYYKKGVAETMIPELSIYEAIKENNKDRLQNVALDLRSSSNNFEKGIEITYKKYFQRMEDIAKSYASMGLKVNEMLVTILPNIPESRILIYGLNILGVTVYPVSPMISANGLDAILSENGVKNVAVFGGFYDKFAEVLKNRNLDSLLYVTGMESLPQIVQVLNKVKMRKNNAALRKDNVLLWDEFAQLKKGYSGKLKPYYDKDHVAIVVGTSGTTGIPKGVCLTDYNLNAIALQHGLSGILSEEDVLLDALIQSIGYGISTMHYSTYFGYKNILIPELLFEKFPEVLCKTKPDHFTGGPVHMQYLAKSKEFLNGELPKLKNLVSGGATLPKELEKELNHVDVGFQEDGIEDPRIIVRQGFGATENGGCGAYAKQGAYKFGGIGIPLPFDTIAIFEPNTDKELPYNTEGEICISGPTVMKEYLNNEAETKKVLKKHRDGQVWLHLADLGYMDEDGQVYMTDRIKNIFMRTGFNVHPSKIAEFLMSLPYVADASVIGFSHPTEQKVPVAFVVLKEEYIGKETEILEMLKASCYNNLEESSLPYEFVFVDTLPRNLGGKVDENILISLANINYMENSKVQSRILKIKK